MREKKLQFESAFLGLINNLGTSNQKFRIDQSKFCQTFRNFCFWTTVVTFRTKWFTCSPWRNLLHHPRMSPNLLQCPLQTEADAQDEYGQISLTAQGWYVQPNSTRIEETSSAPLKFGDTNEGSWFCEIQKCTDYRVPEFLPSPGTTIHPKGKRGTHSNPSGHLATATPDVRRGPN